MISQDIKQKRYRHKPQHGNIHAKGEDNISKTLVNHGRLQGKEQGSWGQGQGSSTECFMTADMELHKHVTVLVASLMRTGI